MKSLLSLDGLTCSDLNLRAVKKRLSIVALSLQDRAQEAADALLAAGSMAQAQSGTSVSEHIATTYLAETNQLTSQPSGPSTIPTLSKESGDRDPQVKVQLVIREPCCSRCGALLQEESRK